MTVRSPLWDALAIGAAFLLIGGVTGGFAAALACIGTLDREARPVLAARGWLAAKEAAAMAWWHAHRLPVLGLLYPHPGRRVAKETSEWHPLDEEAGDGANDNQAEPGAGTRAAAIRADHARGPGGSEQALPAGRPGSGDERSHDLMADGFGGWLSPECAAGQPPGECSYRDCADPRHMDDDLRGHHDDWAAGRLTHEGGDDDLAGLSAEDTDTLSAIRAINAEHLVPTNEPPVHMCPPDGGDGLMPCCGDTPFEHRADRMTLDPALVTCITGDQARRETSGPGGLPGAIPPAPAATGQPGPEAGPPGPASAGGPPFAPVTTASCAAEDIAAKGDSTGPGAIIICSECDYPLHACPDCDDAVGHDGCDDHWCAGEPARRPSGRPPAAGPGRDQLSRLISGYLGAAEAMLPAWDQVLACSMRRELTAGAP